ncbi:hypothetical protein [Archangium lansingense]|uniref:Lipoprotein n=1 Tax=Archangium lansingense TaxID=2995310 RepID=A0ABT4A3U4_9BACT|nr:hypothetical protein [Archangium lansinium]MCY1076319.1 hypothetical protein [Archangium lansinium]
MTRSSPRPLLPWLACALLTAACNLYQPVPEPEGECTGTYKGQDVSWPIITTTSVQSNFSHSDGSTNNQLSLHYTTEGFHGLQGFGASILLRGKPLFEGVGPLTVKLVPREGQLVPEETSLVRKWEGNVGTGQIGYLSPPGVPMEGSVTLARVIPDYAEGHFIYHYADGSELTCTFNVPDRLYDDPADDYVDYGEGGP